jgi:cytochrome c2
MCLIARKAKLAKTLTVIVVLLLSFVLGALFARYKPYPYHQVVSFAVELRKAAKRPFINKSAILSQQYTRDQGPVLESREVDTALLPLIVQSVHISANQSFPQSAGGITHIGDRILLADRLGGFYSLIDNTIHKCAFPPIPNNIDAYITSMHSPLGPSTLRLHDIEYLPSSHRIAISHERFDTTLKLPRPAVSIISIDPDSLNPVGEWKVIFEGSALAVSQYGSHGGGGRLAEKDSNRILLSVGDYNQDSVMIPSGMASQDPSQSFGKIIEIELATGASRIISTGHRNPQGLHVTSSGEVYTTEHGPAGGDELNLLVEGSNYGWPLVTFGTDYGVYNWPPSQFAGSHAGYSYPMFAWVPSIGVSNLIRVEKFHPSWDGDLLVASLKAASLFRLHIKDNRVVYSEPIWLGHRIRDIVQLRSGKIAFWTDDARLMIMDIDRIKLQSNRRGMGFIGQSELALCMRCHHFDTTGPTHLAPSLGNIVGRQVASDGFKNYSDALRSKGGVWTIPKLREYIADPGRFAPGTTMPHLNLSPEAVEEIVAHLANTGARNMPAEKTGR